MQVRLKTELFVKAGIRHCETQFIPAMLRRRGDKDAGALFIKVNRLDGCSALFSRVTSFSGKFEWKNTSAKNWLPDEEIEKRLKTEVSFDPDLWIVEVENPDGINPFEELTNKT